MRAQIAFFYFLVLFQGLCRHPGENARIVGLSWVGGKDCGGLYDVEIRGSRVLYVLYSVMHAIGELDIVGSDKIKLMVQMASSLYIRLNK